tara:strand:+ start:17737 stop:18429 length:693 start_codon:yes stop_codon:yes gene_type:complete
MTQNTPQNLIIYRLRLSENRAVEHIIDLNGPPDLGKHADWTQLDFYKCPHCPLKSERVPHCPLAASLETPVRLLSNLESHTPVDVQVIHRGRDIRKKTTLQRAAGSILGAIGASSGCPHTSFLKPMAWFHQPFSDDDETQFRAIGTYLLGQHLRGMQGLTSDWGLDGLRDAYKKLRLVNQSIAQRLRHAAQEDSSINGLILLDLLASSALSALDQYEGELDAYFAFYLSD